MNNKKIVLNGIITRGLGEGTFFMSMEHYKNEIKKKLGFDAYPGTLNLEVNITKINQLKNITPLKVNGFKLRNKQFGSVNCYKAKIKKINGSIIIPELTRHKNNIIEFIAPVHLKSELKLKDGDKITVKIFNSQ